MIVMKFGGSSVKNADRMRAVGQIVSAARDRRPLIVLSAMGGVTDMLHRLATDAAQGKPDTTALFERHRAVCADLELSSELVDPLLTELTELARGISMIGELTQRTLDRVASFGERLSVRIFAAQLSASGIPARALDSWQLGLVGQGPFGSARFCPDEGRLVAALEAMGEVVPVVTGYVVHNDKGEIVTLGRGGSDYSASAIGAFAGAEEIQIWTDVDGVMTADPSLIGEARPIGALSFEEASEVAYYGARVLHPATIQPAIQDAIPVRVLNTYRPQSPGTKITREAVTSAEVAKAVVHKRGIQLVNVVSNQMLNQYGFLARIFEVFSRNQVVIDMVATSEVSVSVTCDREENLDDAIAELRGFSEVTVERDQAIVCVVGHGMKEATGVAGRVFVTLADAGVAIRMISQGATRINIGMIVAGADAEKAVKALHVEFFE